MTVIEKILAVLKERGPLSPSQLTEKLPGCDYLSTVLSQYSRRGRLRRKGHGKKAIYSIGDGKPRAAPPQRRAKRATRAKPAGRSASPRSGNGAFLAALTSDHCIALIRGGRAEVLSREHSLAVADLVLEHFES